LLQYDRKKSFGKVRRRIWAGPAHINFLGAFFAAVRQKTGLSAPIQRILLCKIRKDFRFYPLLGPRPRAHSAR
jgi:hypothetical protein